MYRYQSARRRGFTLLEVMLVLGILAMLALFVVPKFVGTSKAARVEAARAMVGSPSSLAPALGFYYQRLGTFPEELVDLVERPDDIDEDDDRWYQFYPEALFIDPWNRELVYKFPGEVRENEYDLLSMGPDGEEDTDDDITNYRKED